MAVKPITNPNPRPKENLNRAMSGEVDDCLDLEATHHIHCGQTEDHRNATKAFVEKKEPVFKGR